MVNVGTEKVWWYTSKDITTHRLENTAFTNSVVVLAELSCDVVLNMNPDLIIKTGRS